MVEGNPKYKVWLNEVIKKLLVDTRQIRKNGIPYFFAYCYNAPQGRHSIEGFEYDSVYPVIQLKKGERLMVWNTNEFNTEGESYTLNKTIFRKYFKLKKWVIKEKIEGN